MTERLAFNPEKERRIYIVHCTDCASEIFEGNSLLMAQESAQYHFEETGHFPFIFNNGEMIINDDRGRI